MFLTLALSAFGLLAQVAPAPVAEALTAGARIEHTLGAADRQLFTIAVNAGEFVFLTVDQQDGDVRLQLTPPRGDPAVVVDSSNGAFGLERLAFIAQETGAYQLEVRGPAVKPPGGYTLVVHAIRPPTSADVALVAAEKAMNDADNGRRAATAQSRAAASAGYRDAAAKFHALGEGFEYQETLALYSAGFIDLTRGETRAAADILSHALEWPRANRDRLLPSIVNTLAGAHDILGDFDGALTGYNEALELFRGYNNRSGEGVALGNIGKMYADGADFQRALAYYRDSFEIVKAIANRRVMAIALHNIGVAYTNLGEVGQAVDAFDESLEHSRALGLKDQEADTLSAMGRAELSRGDTTKALAHYEHALDVRREGGDQRSLGITLNGLARVCVAIRDLVRARSSLNRALDLFVAAADRRNEALARADLAELDAAQNQPVEALAFAQQSLALARAIGDTNTVARALNITARVELAAGRLTEAERAAADAVSAVESVRGRATGRELRATYLAQQRTVFETYIDVLMREHDQQPTAGFDRRAFEAADRGRARSLVDSLADTGDRISRGADPVLLDRERQLAKQINLKADRRLGLSGRAPAAEAATLDREVRTLQAAYDEARAALRRSSPGYAAVTEPDRVTVASMQADLIDDGTTLLQYSLGSSVSYLWVVDRERVSSFRLAGEDAIATAVRRVRELVTAARTPVNSAALTNSLSDLSSLVLTPARAVTFGKRLVVVPDGALQYVPFAMLPRASRAGAAPAALVTQFDVVTVPSASAIQGIRAQVSRRARPPNGVAVLADPVFAATDDRVARRTVAPPPDVNTADDAARDVARILAHLAPAGEAKSGTVPRLPFTRSEAGSILQVAANTPHLEALGFDANKELVLRGDLAKYRYVHLATHGVVDTELGDLSAVVLSLVDANGAARDGLLRAYEIYNLDLPADLVVLSACETGLGREIRGEGLVGLTRGFMYAGAARVVVSLWSVSDRATAALMARFYQEMLVNGKPAVAALRAAQVFVRSQPQWRHPFYWAGFVIEGEWR